MNKLNKVLAFAVLAAVISTSLYAQAEETSNGNQVVNINTATVKELTFLPGVGESRAMAIVKYRSNNPFKNVDEIVKIKGIGRKGLEKMRPYLTVEGETTAKTKIKTQR